MLPLDLDERGVLVTPMARLGLLRYHGDVFQDLGLKEKLTS